MANRIVEVEFHTICGGQLCVNVMHFMADVAETDLFVIARSVVRSLDGTDTNAGFDLEKYVLPMTADCFVSSLVARVVGASPGARFPKLYAATDFVGSIGGDLVSATVAYNIKLVTASGPDFTGRVFLPGVSENFIYDNRFDATSIAAINQWRSDLADGIEVGADTFMPCVYRRSTFTAELVTNSQLSPNPGTIRKRAIPY